MFYLIPQISANLSLCNAQQSSPGFEAEHLNVKLLSVTCKSM